MKLSLSWIFDHVDAKWQKQKVEEIVATFNQVTAEIESFSKISLNTKPLFMGCVRLYNDEKTVLFIPELNQEIILPPRARAKIFEPQDIDGLYYLVFQEEKKFRWATCKDVGLDKEGVLHAFDILEADAKGGWRKQWACEDIILDVDNKSITHRPDLWGHRGLAREMAAFLNLPFKPKEEFFTEHSVQQYDKKSKANDECPFAIEINAPEACDRFAGLYFSSIENKACNVFVASRLINVGVRPINGIVDLTNYVMLDWSQPVHAYDAQKINGCKLIARMAQSGEKLTLLDGQKLKLTNQDLVIADGQKAVGLAGVMGGLHDSIGVETTEMFFEAAHFTASYVRRTALRHGVRTDSSTRFEKTLDPNQNIEAILRFIALTKQVGINVKIGGDIISVGKPFKEKIIGVTHSFLEKRAGVRLEQDDVVIPLQKLGFVVHAEAEVIGDENDVLYTVTVPSFRGAKDIEIKEDILEEIVRCFGFNKIALTLPAIKKEPHDMTEFLRLRKIKNFLSYAARMMEQQNYLYYDESFLTEVGLTFSHCLEITNPVSENNKRLASSLLPNLFKNIKENSANENSLRFFECGRTCRYVDHETEEKRMVTGVFFEKRKPFDFYEGKQYVNDLLHICGFATVEWRKIEKHLPEHVWLMPYQSAELFYHERRIGVVGKVDTAFLSKLGALPESEAFCFDLEGDRLLQHRKEVVQYCPISKYQGVTFDFCFMVPLKLTVEQLQSVLFDSDDLIERVELVDFFDKKEWVEQRSVAFRLWVSHPEKTLQKEEIDLVRANALKAAEEVDAKLRV